MKLVQVVSSGRRIACHVKVDTGLTRAGVAPTEVLPLLESMAQYPALRFTGLYTHFASADEPDKSQTWRQLEIFREVDRQLTEAGYRPQLRHAANSAAALDIAEAHLDLIRCGIATYGYYPSQHVQRTVRLTPALTLVSELTRVVVVPAGTGVGYSHEHVCARKSLIGLAPIGYGDGLPRTLGNGRGHVLVRGHAAPIVGRVSMDQITIDLTEIAGASVGDRVTILGEDGARQQWADEVADAAGTISYEILTRIMPRVPRVYRSNSEIAIVDQPAAASDGRRG